MAEETAGDESSVRWRSRLIRAAVGLVVSLVAVALLLRKVSLADVWEHLRGAELGWFAGMVGVKWGVALAKGLRWRGVLLAMDARRWRGVTGALSIGYLMNLLLPLRLGELMRVAALRRQNPSASPGAALASIAAERILDALTLTLFTCALLPFVPAPDWLRSGVPILLLFVVTVAAVAMARPVHDALAARLPQRGIFLILRRVIDALSSGTSVFRQPRALAAAAAWTAAIWLGDALTSWCGMNSFDLGVSYPGAVIMTLLYAVSLILPSAPLQLGTHQALTVLFLEPFGVPADKAVAFSVLLQCSNLLTWLPLGGAALLRQVSMPRRHAR